MECARNAAGPGRGPVQGRQAVFSLRCLFPVLLAIFLIAIPVSAAEPGAPPGAGTAPETVTISAYVIDFNRVDVGAGTVGADFYVTLHSAAPVSIDDIELMNGMITSVSLVNETPYGKEYRIIAVLTAEPDLSRYPFDRHTLAIKLEPRVKNEREMVLVINPDETGLYRDAQIPGWTLTGSRFAVTNESYLPGEVPYSRAIFSYGVERDITSTLLKFFLPLMLIVIVSLSSLMMKVSSRLGLNASMFLAAVLIHWRVADSIPAVTYATFLDLFMIVTYATLVLVLFSGILVMKFSEAKDTARLHQVNFWSIRLIPAFCITLYFLLFLTIAV